MSWAAQQTFQLTLSCSVSREVTTNATNATKITN
jgi:hypothetical protein